MSVIAVLFTLFTFLVFLLAISSYRQSIAAKNWKSTSGKILESFVKEKVREGRTRHKPRVKYQFSYLGQVYEGRSLTSGARYGTQDKAHAEKLLEPYPKGAEVQVYFDPKKPKRNALEINSEEPSLVFLAVSTVMMLCSVMFLFFSV